MTADKLPVGLVLLGLIALFLILRLRSILGKRQGFEGVPELPAARRPAGPVIEARAEAPAVARKLPDAASAAGQALAAMKAIDRSFEAAAFLSGAEAAFRLIVTAFAAGDREKLRPLLLPHVADAFEAAITAREAEGQTQKTEIRSILESSIEAASLTGTEAAITVRFVSHQIAVTLDRQGGVVAGADAVTELVDVWDFARDFSAKGPTWRLAAARNA